MVNGKFSGGPFEENTTEMKPVRARGFLHNWLQLQ